MFSCRTKLEKLLCLKYCGSRLRLNRSCVYTTKLQSRTGDVSFIDFTSVQICTEPDAPTLCIVHAREE